MKSFAYFLIGVVAGSVLVWIGFLSWAAVNLNPNDSLFDRDPSAMNLFVIAWISCAVVGGASGLFLGFRKPKR